MEAMRNPGRLVSASDSGALETFVCDEYPERNTALLFSQYFSTTKNLPPGLDPLGIIATHFWRGDE